MKIGAFDYSQLHIVKRPDGALELYERRLHHFIARSNGKPAKAIPNGLEWKTRERFKDAPTDRIIQGYLLVPVNLSF